LQEPVVQLLPRRDGDLVRGEPALRRLLHRQAADRPGGIARSQAEGAELFHQYPGELLEDHSPFFST
jgi:hypothetical protein